MPTATEPSPLRNEIVPATRFKSNVGTAVIVILSIASAVGVTVSFKRDVEEIGARQKEEKSELIELRSQMRTMHENLLRLAYSVDPKTAVLMKPLQPTTATP